MGASAPAITGQASFGTWYNDNAASSCKGAFYRDRVSRGYNEHNNSLAGDLSYIDASRSSKIYGASTTIRPISRRVRFMIRF